MKSLSELLKQLGLNPTGHSVMPHAGPLLDQIRTEGAVVVVKFDGQRSKNCYTLVISDGPLGEYYFRKDGDDLEALINEGINFYDNLIWMPPTPDSERPPTPRG